MNFNLWVLTVADEGIVQALSLRIKPVELNDRFERCQLMEARLSSRCQGLLDVRQWWSRNGSDEKYENHYPFSTVQFLHQTAADFLDLPENRSILDTSPSPEFDPYIAMIASGLGRVKMMNKFDVKYDPDQPRRIFSQSMQYAQQSKTTSVKIMVQLLDAMYEAVHTVVRKNYEAQKQVDLLQFMRNGMLSCAVQYHCLLPYVKEKLETMDHLLKPALLAIPLETVVWEMHDQSLKDLEERFTIMALLLKHGAIVNHLSDGNTVWQDAVAIAEDHFIVGDGRGPPKPRELELWAKILHCLLDHGAIPDVMIPPLCPENLVEYPWEFLP